jgi:hypothetical protein
MVNQIVTCNSINDVYYLYNATTLRADRNLPFKKGERGNVLGVRGAGYSFLDEMTLVLTENGATGWIPTKFVTIV